MHRRWPRRSTRSSPRSSDIQRKPASTDVPTRPRWPMIVLKTPKGWTGPEGRRRPAGRRDVPRAPGAAVRAGRAPRAPRRRSRTGCGATGPRSCSTSERPAHAGAGGAGAERRAPDGRQPARQRRHPAARPAAAGLPRLRRRGARRRERHGIEDTRVLGKFLRDVIKLNREQRNFRIFGPDETLSNRLERRLRGDQHASGRARPSPTTIISRPTAASWRCSASTSARAGSRATCSPAGTGCSTATRRSSTSSTRCSTSTPSG